MAATAKLPARTGRRTAWVALSSYLAEKRFRMKKPQTDGYVDTSDPLHKQVSEMSAEEVIELMKRDPAFKKTSSASVETEEEGVRHEAIRRARVRQLTNPRSGPRKPER